MVPGVHARRHLRATIFCRRLNQKGAPWPAATTMTSQPRSTIHHGSVVKVGPNCGVNIAEAAAICWGVGFTAARVAGMVFSGAADSVIGAVAPSGAASAGAVGGATTSAGVGGSTIGDAIGVTVLAAAAWLRCGRPAAELFASVLAEPFDRPDRGRRGRYHRQYLDLHPCQCQPYSIACGSSPSPLHRQKICVGRWARSRWKPKALSILQGRASHPDHLDMNGPRGR